MIRHQDAVTVPRAAVNVWPEFGQMIGVGRNLAYEIANSGRIRVVRAGSRILIPVTAVEEFLDAASEGPRQA